jgi:alkanesulfonate monooxygenase SsuD/methylene tetrahydromethanopterin reductase-like flavin-dependent oxidoreductase (luciferase family)
LRFGIALESFTPPGKQPDPTSIYQMAETAERLGFDSVWVWDHILLGSRKIFPVLDSLTTLASIGARTRKIKLGTSVLVLSLRNPVIVAKVISTIHYLTGGRLVIGTASGWYKREFDTLGVPFEKRGKIFEERFKLVKSLLMGRDISYDSDGIRLEHASMEPTSTTPITMLIGGYSDLVLARAGRIADGWISYYYTPEGFSTSWKKVVNSAIKNGRNPDTLRRVDIVPLSIEQSFEEGDRIAKQFTATYMDLPKDTDCTPDSAVRGTLTDCISQIKKYEDAGVQDLIFIPCFYDLKYVQLAGEKILPKFTGSSET